MGDDATKLGNLPVNRFPSSYPPSLSGDSQSQDSQHCVITEPLEEPLFTLQPGTFEIVLCVDNREVYGSGYANQYYWIVTM